MAWLRIDDRVRTHPKVAKAGPAAAWLWFCGICYCREHLTDGFIPAPVIASLAMNLTQPVKHADRLVEVNLWHRVEDGYQVHDFLDWNPSKADVMSLRDKERDKKRTQRGTGSDVPAGHVERSESVPQGQVGDSRERARDRAGDAGLGSGSSVVSADLQLEEIPISTAPPVWRKRGSRVETLTEGESYHRRNCAPWAFAACEAGLCVPKYLWPQWEKRQPVDALRGFVSSWAARAAGDTAEAFWPRAFALHFGEAISRASASRTGDTVDAARAYMAGEIAALRSEGE